MAKKIELAISISHPPDGAGSDNADVKEEMEGSGRGVLCRANGPASIPAGQSFLGVYLKVVPHDSTPPWTWQDLQSNAEWEITSLEAGNTWNAPEMLTSDCSSVGANNLLLAAQVNQVFNPDTEEWDPVGSIAKTPFTGVAVSDCARLVVEDKAEVARSFTSTASSIDMTNQYHPVDRCGDWMLYRGLSVSRIGKGNVLMLNGEPLHARVLAVSAANVCWEHMTVHPTTGKVLKGGFVRRAAGDLKFPEPKLLSGGPYPDPVLAPHPFAFPEAPQYALLVTQETSVPKPFVHVIASECREQPDFVHLNPEESVRIQVNYARAENLRSGGFDLWVKVITT